ncbi:MAG: VWA domain-containing protein [Burkholderiales bacterium]|nr:VWA domain-containing protein [Burkholderiales bacterium]
MTALAPPSRLAANVMEFARVLRRSGLPVGPGKTLAAVEAAAWVGPQRRDDFRAALAATLLDRAEQRPLFDQAFRYFWRDPKLMERAMQRLLPRTPGPLARPDDEAPAANRLAQALAAPREHAAAPEPAGPIELDAALSFSAAEVLQAKDFETMSLDELAQAKRMLRMLHLPLPRVPARRYARHRAGRQLDVRTTLRQSIKFGGEWLIQYKRVRRTRPSVLVVLCDISGSMARYSRMLLHFVHAVAAERGRVHAFTFATRLTNITRALRHRDVDQALDEVSRVVRDWSGGTRIGACLDEFNRHWARRLLGQGAVVLVVSDGLDCGAGPQLDEAMARLRASCRRIVWLNPLLRFAGFEPKAAGIRAMLPYVDIFLPAHNITSLIELAHALAAEPAPRLHRAHYPIRKRRLHDGDDRRATHSGPTGNDVAGAQRPRNTESLHPGL